MKELTLQQKKYFNVLNSILKRQVFLQLEQIFAENLASNLLMQLRVT